jgi:hypothetical protein
LTQASGRATPSGEEDVRDLKRTSCRFAPMSED